MTRSAGKRSRPKLPKITACRHCYADIRQESSGDWQLAWLLAESSTDPYFCADSPSRVHEPV
jgi:hypothetical protein